MPTQRRVRVWPPARLMSVLSNMATSLFQNGRITTTEQVFVRCSIRNKSVVHKLFTEIAEQMEQRAATPASLRVASAISV